MEYPFQRLSCWQGKEMLGRQRNERRVTAVIETDSAACVPKSPLYRPPRGTREEKFPPRGEKDPVDDLEQALAKILRYRT